MKKAFQNMETRKTFISLCLLTLSWLAATGQSKVHSFPQFIRSFERNVQMGPLADDSCLLTTCIIKIDLDSNYKVVQLSVSDMARPWVKQEIKRIFSKLNVAELELYAKSKSHGAQTFLLPFFTSRRHSSCQSVVEVNSRLFYFSGEFARGELLAPLEIIYTKVE